MNYIDVGAFEQFPEVMIPLHIPAANIEGRLEMFIIDIADGNEARSGNFQMPVPHPSDTDDGFRDVLPGANTFDYDSYKILFRYLRNRKNRKTVRRLTRSQYDSLLSELGTLGIN